MELAKLLREHRLLAIVRGRDPEAAYRTVCVLADSGVELVEVSLTGADAVRVIERGARTLGDQALLGAGTVLSAGDAARACDAGARFLVTPAQGDGVAAGVACGVPVLAGALTPTEVTTAVAAGASAVKLFPASLGGPGYLSALRDPFPEVPFVPVGGVDAAAATEYLRRGAVAVGVGSPLTGDAAHGGDLDALRARVSAFRAAVSNPGGEP